MDTMMDLWKDGLAPLKTPATFHRFSSQHTFACFKSPESDMEDSGYSTCSSVEIVLSKTPACCDSSERRPAKKIIPEIPPGYTTTVGLKVLDFFEQLDNRDILDELLKYLSPDDLIRCSLVSKSWNSILQRSRISRTKQSIYLSTRRFRNKENLCRPGEVTSDKSQKRGWERTVSTPLALISTSRQLNFTTPTQTPVSPSKMARVDRFDVYREAGNMLQRGEAQMSCPRCTLPAKKNGSINLGLCTNSRCRFQFCLSCRGEHHTNTTCLLLRSPEKLIRSRRITKHSYRRNMRRL